jgi:hypothetical protein
VSWTVYAEKFVTADFSGSLPRVYQPFTVARDVKIKAMRTWFVFYNSPLFTTLGMRIYDDRGGSPQTVRATFDKTWVPGEANTNTYGLLEIYFDFNNPLWLKAGTYHLAPWAVGPTFDSSSHLAWVKGFPDPNMDVGAITISLATMPTVPYYVALIGSEK